MKIHQILKEADIHIPKPEDTLGVKRHEMPQVGSEHYPSLFDYINDHGGHFTNETIHARDLKPVQGEFSKQGVEKMMRGRADIKSGKRKSKRIIVSSDDYIIDGHHRWLAAYNHDDDIEIMRVDIPVKKLMQLLHDFKHTTYKDIYAEKYTGARKTKGV